MKMFVVSVLRMGTMDLSYPDTHPGACPNPGLLG